ncbi:hypothetical protein [Pseudokineococcus sp. 1T1Z-3]|uniref:hypothetical protein n=1 Tax=Pseudokineococcus sp. 1T1Z-3 TaxID=3132745 RepID=UPI00309E7009
MRRSYLAPALAVSLLLGCARLPEAPAFLLQPADLEGVEVVEAVEAVLPMGSFLPCQVLGDPQRHVWGTGVHVEYRVEVDDAAGFVISGAFAPADELATELLDFLDGAASACRSDVEVVLDEGAAAAVADAADVDEADVRVLRSGPGWTPNWRAYVLLDDGRLVVVQAGGTDVVAAIDLPATTAAAVSHLRDHHENPTAP